MRKFYALLRRRYGEPVDVDRAAELEVEWWRVHRIHQREVVDEGADPLSAALATLYSHTYGVERDAVLLAARERAQAMDLSDRWVEGGCDLGSPLIAQERAALVRSYAGLLAAVHR
jgi:fatty-acid desaturase